MKFWHPKKRRQNSKVKISEIAVLSAPRSGTNFFCECLADLPEVMGMHEIFNKDGVFGVDSDRKLSILNEVTGLNASSLRSEQLINFFRDRPIEAVEALSETARQIDKKFVSYKIFPGHVSNPSLEELLSAKHRYPIVLTRRRLDVYVSLQKARISKSWRHSDTSDLKPRIETHEFLEWSKANDDWYRQITDSLDRHGRGFRILSYSADVDIPKSELMRNLVTTLRFEGIDVSAPSAPEAERFNRQDLKTDPFSKIANGDEVHQGLAKQGMLSYALEEPLSGHPAKHGLVKSSQ